MSQLITRSGIALAFAALAACGGDIQKPDAGIDPDLVCDDNPPPTTLSQVWVDVIQPACAESCHPGNDSPTDLGTPDDLYAHVGRVSMFADATGSLRQVDPRSLPNSSMWLKVLGGSDTGRRGPKGESVGARMPYGGTLTDTQKARLKDWICSGAPG